jgi:hypothetical protein
MNRLFRILDALFGSGKSYQVRAFKGGFIAVFTDGGPPWPDRVITQTGEAYWMEKGVCDEDVCPDMAEAHRRIDAHKRLTGVIVEWEGR